MTAPVPRAPGARRSRALHERPAGAARPGVSGVGGDGVGVGVGVGDPGSDHDHTHASATAALLDALRAVSRELRVAERDAEQRLGLPPAQVHTLRQLGQASASSLAELGERTHTDPSSASVVVQRLVERGLVARTHAPGDRRRVELALTPSGRALLRRLPGHSADRVEEAVGALGVQRTAALARRLEELARTLQRDGRDVMGRGA